jgi:hypothetical protein
MLLDVTRVLVTFEGVPLQRGPDDPRPLTLQKVFVEALLGVSQADANISGEEKLKRFLLAKLIYSTTTGPIELSSDQVAFALKLVDRSWGTLVVGLVREYISSLTDEAKQPV